MPRPKKADPREHPAYARLSKHEWALFERLIENRQAEVRQATGDIAATQSQGDVIRWLIVREAMARGLNDSAVHPFVGARSEEPPRHVPSDTSQTPTKNRRRRA